jgi:hypothetical protein
VDGPGYGGFELDFLVCERRYLQRGESCEGVVGPGGEEVRGFREGVYRRFTRVI